MVHQVCNPQRMCKNTSILKKKKYQDIQLERAVFKHKTDRVSVSVIRREFVKLHPQKRPRDQIASLHPKLGCQGLVTNCRTQHAYWITDAGPPAETQSLKNSCSSDKGLSGQTRCFSAAINVQRKSRGTGLALFSYMPLQIPSISTLVLMEAKALICVFNSPTTNVT